MTREEQIIEAGIEYTYKNRPMCIGGGAFSEMVDEMNRNKAFEEGAKWADKTMIERACKWLYHNTNKHIDDKYLTMSFNLTNEMIEDFRKAMGE